VQLCQPERKDRKNTIWGRGGQGEQLAKERGRISERLSAMGGIGILGEARNARFISLRRKMFQSIKAGLWGATSQKREPRKSREKAVGSRELNIEKKGAGRGHR